MDDKKKSGGVKGSKGGEIMIKEWGKIDKGVGNDKKGVGEY